MKKFTSILMLFLACVGTAWGQGTSTQGNPSKSSWTVKASTQEMSGEGGTNGRINTILDGNPATFWHSSYNNNTAAGGGYSQGAHVPHYFEIDLQKSTTVTGFSYTPRNNNGNQSNGSCWKYKFYVSDQPFNLQYNVASQTEVDKALALTGEAHTGTFPQNSVETQSVLLQTAKTGQYILFVITESRGSFGNCAEFDVYTQEHQPVEVTYNYKLEGTTTTIQKKAYQLPGTALEAPALNVPYVTFTQPSGTVGSSAQTVDVTCTANLPFKTSTTYKDATWHRMKIQRDQVKTSSYNPGTSKSNNYTTVPYTSTCEWFAFMGNAFDGFKIYNYAAGENKVLWSANVTNNQILTFVDKTTATDNKDWVLLQNGNLGTVFKKKDSNNGYLNDVQDQLGYWQDGGAATDKGSSFKFEVVNTATELTNAALGTRVRTVETKSLGTDYVSAAYGLGLVTESNQITQKINAFKASVSEANAQAVENAYNTFNTANQAALAALKNDLSSKYYRIKNTDNRRVNYPYMTAISTPEAKGKGEALNEKDASQLWQFKFDEATNTFTVYSPNHKKYLDRPDSGAKLIANGAKYTISPQADKKMNLRIGDRYLVMTDNPQGSASIGGWGEESAAGDAAWTFEPVTELNIPLATVGNGAYASIYLPFAVSAVKDATAYTGTLNNNVLKMKQVAEFAEETGIILQAAANTPKATLTIATAAVTTTDKGSLQGTLTGKAYANEYVLGKGKTTGAIGFYKKNGTNTTIGANRAFLPAQNAAQAIELDFTGDVTGIESVMGEADAKAPIFDLSGRRVLQTVKGGFYIQNGKKFIAR